MDSEIQSNFTYDNSDRNEASVCYEMCQGAAYVGLKVNAAPDEIKHVSQLKEKVDRKQILIAKMLCETNTAPGPRILGPIGRADTAARG